MIVLGIETSCDETSAAIVEDGKNVTSCVVASQIEKHKIYGGVVPEIASRSHIEAITGIVEETINSAKIPLSKIDVIGVTNTPGLIGCLLVGVNFAKSLSYTLNTPLVAVNHLKAHIAANYLEHANLKPPFLALVASGGHTMIVLVKSYTEFEIVGKTQDDAAGEALDKAARVLGLPYPGGVHLDQLASQGGKNTFEFKRPVVQKNPLDFSFSGLKTNFINTVHNLQQKLAELPRQDLCFSFREVVVNYLVDNFIACAKKYGCKKLAICGGVACNTLLRTSLLAKCKENGFEFFAPSAKYCGDNAAMVASQAFFEYKSGKTARLNLNGCACVGCSNLT